MVEYTRRWKNKFQIRSQVTLDDRDFNPDIYDIVKWEYHEPYEVTDWKTGEKKFKTENCFSIGSLEWDSRNECFQFHSCGTRYLKYYEEGLNEWLLKFIEFETFNKISEMEGEDY